MKKYPLLATMIFSLCCQANATGAVSSGGAPPVPASPHVEFQYDCRILMSRVQAIAATRFEGSIQARKLVSWKPSDSEPFNGAIKLSDLAWRTVQIKSKAQPLQVAVEDQTVGLSFEGTEPHLTVKLGLTVSQDAETGKYTLSSHAEKHGPFLKGELIHAEANVEERANWVDGKPPGGLSMNYSSLKVDCKRLK